MHPTKYVTTANFYMYLDWWRRNSTVWNHNAAEPPPHPPNDNHLTAEYEHQTENTANMIQGEQI